MQDLQFIVMTPSKERARDLVAQLEVQSKSFVSFDRMQNEQGKIACSSNAWSLLTQIFELLRNEQDQGRIPSALMNQPTGKIVKNANQAVIGEVLAAKKISSRHSYTDCTLRDTLNKLAHYDKLKSAYRVTRSGGHYLILSGKGPPPARVPWIVEIHLSKLIKQCRKALA